MVEIIDKLIFFFARMKLDVCLFYPKNIILWTQQHLKIVKNEEANGRVFTVVGLINLELFTLDFKRNNQSKTFIKGD